MYSVKYSPLYYILFPYMAPQECNSHYFPMSTFPIPYHHGFLKAGIPEERLVGCFTAAGLAKAADETTEIESALNAPIGSPSLEALAQGKRSAVIIVSDHTRPVPSHLLLPPILRRLRSVSPEIEVTILVATGCHRATRPDEIRHLLGEDIAANERIVIHDSEDAAVLASPGVLPSGAPLEINRLALEADLLIGTGFIEPHFFAGFSGGRKCILPGIASRRSVHSNHCAQFIASPFARTGNLDGNPIHNDMLAAARLAKVAFILNVVLDSAHRVVRAFAGDLDAAHRAGCEFLASRCEVSVPESDIVLTSNGGYPLDQNVYQSVKGMTAGEACCRPGGVIILCASCSDGIGGESFRKALAAMTTPQELLKNILSVPREETLVDQWQYQILARVLSNHEVIIVTNDLEHSILKEMHFRCASSIEEAVAEADRLLGYEGKIAVIPDGVSVIVRKCL